MLPPPKRDADAVKFQNKPPARKVFSLKTGAEPGFSREGDDELRQLFAEQRQGNGRDEDETIPVVPKKRLEEKEEELKTVQGNAFMFKPLSVARGNKKKVKRPIMPKSEAATEINGTEPAPKSTPSDQDPAPTPAPKKVSLFSLNTDAEAILPSDQPEDDDEIIEVLDDDPYPTSTPSLPQPTTTTSLEPQSLSSIASDLNLSASARRQLLGRNPRTNSVPANIINFNTDQEYLANESLRAQGEQVQHNPVRGIAPGKHSLKQLVSVAQGQKDALEESFAMGRRNKKEAGNKYGW
jgi:hypothetical protein